jgi:hypothetical protein
VHFTAATSPQTPCSIEGVVNFIANLDHNNS